MTGTREARFRRVLRWYPRSWREANGEVLLSTWLDEAEHDGRAAPTTAEALSAVVHGVAARVDRRFAVVASLAGVACAAVAGVLSIWAPGGVAGWLVPLLLSGVVPALAALSLIAVLRERGWIGDARTLGTMLIAVVAFMLNTLTYTSWSLGFDAADAGVPATGLAAAWLPLFIAAVVAGATAIAVVVEGLFRRASFPRAPRIVLAGLIGVVAAPVVGYSLMSPAVSAVLVLGVAILSLAPRRRPARAAAHGEESPRVTTPPRPVDERAHARTASTARHLAGIAVVGSVVGVVYALTGSHWSPGAADGTIAMGQGITLLLISAVPLLAAIGLRGAGRPGRTHAVHRWGPLALAVIGVGCVAAAYVYAPDWAAMSPWLQASAVIVGVAIAWWIASRARLPRRPAILTGAIAGLLYAAFVGMMLAPMLAFAVPVAALIIALQPHRSRGHVQPSSAPVPAVR